MPEHAPVPAPTSGTARRRHHRLDDLRRGAVLASLIAAATTLVACGDAADAQGGQPQAPPVSVAPAVQRAVIDSEEFSGRLEASEYVELRPRVAGTIDKVHFVDGALVRKGDLLFSIDPRSFEAEAARAQSQLVSIRSRARSRPDRPRARAEAARLAGRSRSRRSTTSAPATAPRRPRSRAPKPRCDSRASTSSTRRCARRSLGASRAPTSPPATSSTNSRC